MARCVKAVILWMGVRWWANRSPIRSGPEGSSRNEIWFGLPPAPYFSLKRGFVFTSVNSLISPDNSVVTGRGSLEHGYQVLARRYRPGRFSDLIGQDAMVRTLTNAFVSGRLAHAFLLTGVRGVGKTITARIIARALNCTNTDNGDHGSKIEPCGSCENCTAISNGSHVDVLEMDAASRTGVDDIRELIDGVRYLPTYGRYKVYIIDEVHMLSVNAFSALLKTLEEPPPRVTFIFATTEVRKIPVTVISRCQRFDLRRVDTEILTSHFTKIAGAEGSNFDTQALALIVRAADGSVRDGLSLLDQAISHANGDIVSIELVREMIGLADQARVFDLLEEVLKGEIGPALSQLNEQYQAGAEPLVVVQDLLTITHWLTRLKLDPDSIDLVGPPGVDVARGREMADKLGMADLTRVWQMLLKGHNEVGLATSPLEATEMLLVRLAFVADLPSPADLVRKLTEEGSSSHVPKEIPADSVSDSDNQTVAVLTNKSTIISTGPAPELETIALPSNFAAAVRMFADHGKMRLYTNLQDHVHLVRFEPGRIELRLGESAPNHLASNLGKYLHEWTGRRWVVAVSDRVGELTLAEQELAQEHQRKTEAAQDPAVRALLDAFPGAEIKRVRNRGGRKPPEMEENST